MTNRDKERAEIAMKALSELDNITPKSASLHTTAGQARLILEKAKRKIEETFK